MGSGKIHDTYKRSDCPIPEVPRGEEVIGAPDYLNILAIAAQLI